MQLKHFFPNRILSDLTGNGHIYKYFAVDQPPRRPLEFKKNKKEEIIKEIKNLLTKNSWEPEPDSITPFSLL